MTKSFGEYQDGREYKTLNERAVRASAGMMMVLGIIAFVNGFVKNEFDIIPYISGFLMFNFIIGVFINPNYAPTYFLAKIIVKEQTPLPIGAIQKKFAWSLGLGLSLTIFGFSLFLVNDVSFFAPVCLLCIICLALLFLETAFGICVGCMIYHFFIKINLIKQPKIKPNCMGDSCEV